MKSVFSFKTFLSFFVLFIGGLAFYEYRKTTLLEREKQKTSQLLSGLKLDSVKIIRFFKRESQETLSLKQKEGDWFLLEPVEDIANFTELSRWFDTISRHKVVTLDLDSTKAEHYHWGEKPSLELDLSTGESLKLFLSSKSAFDGRWFIKKENQIFLAEQGIDKELKTKNLEDFRSKKIFPFLKHPAQIKIEALKNQNLVFYWKDNSWSLESRKDSNLPLDQKVLSEFWEDLKSLEADMILSSQTLSFEEQLKKYQLEKPAVKITLFYGEEKNHILNLSSIQNGKLYASVSHRDFVFEIPKKTEDELLLLKEQIYDHSFPFDFDLPLVSQIQITTPENTLSLKKQEEEWMIEGSEVFDNIQGSQSQSQEDEKNQTKESQTKKTSNDKDLKQKSEDFLNELKKLKGSRYKKITNEKKPLRSLQLKNNDGELLFELQELEQVQKQSLVKTNLWGKGIFIPKDEIDKIFNSML